MLTSARRLLHYPDPATRADTADVPRDIAVIIAALELDVVFGQGTHTNRPAAGAGNPVGTGGGRLYWETDTSGLFYDTGTVWSGPLNVSAIAAGSVTQAMLAKPSVGAPEIIDGSVGTVELANGAVTAAKIAAALFPSQGAGASTEALRALGTAAGQAAPGSLVPLSGTHAARPAAATALNGLMYYETDSRILFQVQGGSWVAIGATPITGSIVNGAIAAGTGFTLSHAPATGAYTITFSPTLSAAPVVVATITDGNAVAEGILLGSITASGFQAATFGNAGNVVTTTDHNFMFIATPVI